MIRSKTVADYNLLTFGYAERLTSFPIFEFGKSFAYYDSGEI